MTNREIALACYGISEEDSEATAEKGAEKGTATSKTFFETMEMTSNETWEMTDGNIPHIFFYQEYECDPILQDGEPPEREDGDDDDDMTRYHEWRDNIYETRLKKAANWLLLTCTRKITPSGRRESTNIKTGDSSNEKDIYGRADRRHSARF